MSGVTGEESEAQRLEREAKQKEEADEAARNQFPPPPPPMTQQNFLQYMQMLEERQRMTMEQQNKFFQELLQQNKVERPDNQGVTLSDFQNTKPISFAYAPEPMDAEDWLMDTERKLNTVGCNDLEKKDKAILTYVREFSKLSRYAVEEVNTEDKKKKRFLRGLSPQFKVQLRMMRATEFQELVDAATTLEDDFKQLQDEKRKKAKFEPKRHWLEFQTKEGHVMKDCPNKKNGGGQSGGGGNRGGNNGGNWKNKKPFVKLNCTSLEEVVNSDQAVIDAQQQHSSTATQHSSIRAYRASKAQQQHHGMASISTRRSRPVARARQEGKEKK
ncbi:hypothetical protein QYE76_034655 [Lolium multiflorum]|uniref:Retrotransposon gag domain-containing protein n=1 Tax=Lolium multiflorum TaxID=4521 RepID=A0AAD8VKE9_LOLMU|nr:hypothetical protein QYE76_034655 [Lolium multiflorum]